MDSMNTDSVNTHSNDNQKSLSNQILLLLTSKTRYCKHNKACIEHWLRSFFRNVVIGFGLRSAIVVVLGVVRSK